MAMVAFVILMVHKLLSMASSAIHQKLGKLVCWHPIFSAVDRRLVSRSWDIWFALSSDSEGSHSSIFSHPSFSSNPRDVSWESQHCH
ncbi:hypothetical protein K1719_000671 [Acacia pycnantha]|nr:hypothetical protein K1719_000671 [Acacia pycnantha]